MRQGSEELTRWVYQGIWSVLSHWFRVPKQPPTLPAYSHETIESFRPSVGFLRYLKLQFWFLLVLIDLLVLVVWLVILISSPMAGVILALPALVIAVVPDLIAYVAIHLRYDTTWYVVSDRSLRIRRGIWVIRETTITFENVQNVKVTQGPLQRWFGIGSVTVETAGGGQVAPGGHGSHPGAGSHQGLIEGIDNAERIRDMVLTKLRRSRSAGLGDERLEAVRAEPVWRPDHLAVLRDIRDAARALTT
ncbi:MAG: hypothetical protein FJ276_10905 [Planctomycetes bacterium]|nr:hypothetical protein [Planctomycetota bacterium]